MLVPAATSALQKSFFLSSLFCRAHAWWMLISACLVGKKCLRHPIISQEHKGDMRAYHPVSGDKQNTTRAQWALVCVQVAASLMGSALPPGTCAARLMLFVGGPSTEGAGKVVEKELSEPIRSHEVRMMRWPLSFCQLLTTLQKLSLKCTFRSCIHSSGCEKCCV